MSHETQLNAFRNSISSIPDLLGLSDDKERCQRVFLISCGRHKASGSLAAGELYTSSRFRNSKKLAEITSGNYFILSAKHGILNQNDVISNYDLLLSSLEYCQFNLWRNQIFDGLVKHLNKTHKCVVLASGLYATAITDKLSLAGYSYFQPFRGLGIGYQSAWQKVAQRTLLRDARMTDFYHILQQASEIGRGFELGKISRIPDLPTRGVYVFVDPSEPSPYSAQLGRVVRIGTHAISAGSKSSLRNRLRNHFGTGSGLGNHRGSIFRLRVGKALINRSNMRNRYPSWGKGQNADLDTRNSEIEWEKEVSEYLRKLIVIPIPIADPPSKSSARAYVEQQLIALCTEDSVFLDRPSEHWLGRFESEQLVASSGLWNVRGVGSHFDPRAIDLVRSLLHLV